MPAADRRPFLDRFVDRLRAPRAAAPAPTRPLVGYVVHGRDGLHAPSAHVRVVQRIEMLAQSGRADVAQVEPGTFGAGEDPARYDVVLVQRDAVPAADLEPFLARIRATGTRLVAEVDDDFFSAEARARLGRAEYDPDRLASVQTVVRAASSTIVSTPALADAVRASGGRPVVVENQVDPRLWTGPVDAEEPAADPGGPHRVLYAGSRTHGADLALLAPVFDGLVAPDGRPVRLEVVGVTADAEDWYDTLPVPESAGHYPSFVRWLRARARRWDAAVAPLVDEPFNAAKSDLKFVEYTLLGLPVVLSDVGPYRQHRERAAVVPDDPAAWRSAVVAAVTADPSPAARAHVLGHRLIGADTAWERALGVV